MTANQITTLAASGESETLEFKETTGTRREAAMTVCAFLNQSGGQVLFGVTPDGVVTGQQVGDQTIEDLSAELRRIDPPAFPTIERIPVDGGREVIVVSTGQGASRPYMYRGTAYRRVGNTTLAMSTEEYNRILFERMHNEQRWENQPATGWSVTDLDVAEIRRTVAEAVRSGRLDEPVSREPNDMLRGLGLFREGNLFRAAAVLFGNEERLRFEMPQCLLRVARFRGVDKMHFLDNRQFIGNAFNLLAIAERFLRETLPIAGRFEQDRFERIDEPLYPPLATREALANALCHRDYSMGGGSIGLAVYDDRLEVTSAGSLHFGLTPEALFAPHESRPWNPLIADTFFRRGVIEKWGSGTLKMAEQVNSAGLPTPEIKDDGWSVTVRFRHSRSLPQLSADSRPIKRHDAILALLGRAELKSDDCVKILPYSKIKGWSQLWGTAEERVGNACENAGWLNCGFFRLFPANSGLFLDTTHAFASRTRADRFLRPGRFGAMEERQDRWWPSWGFYRSLIGGLLVPDICEIYARYMRDRTRQ